MVRRIDILADLDKPIVLHSREKNEKEREKGEAPEQGGEEKREVLI